MSRRILVFAREAGGAAAIAPVIRQLMPQAQVVVLAKDYAHEVFHRAGLTPVTFAEFSEAALNRLLAEQWEGQLPDVVFTSATSLPQLDMTEKYLWRWAKDRRVPSVAVLDQWQNYALRFSGRTPEERLAYVPDWIAAMDERAKEGLVTDGLPEERIVVTGQPAFDQLARIRHSSTLEEEARLRRTLGVAPDAALVCFVTEAFAQVFGDRLGYTEHSVLRELLSICGRIVVDSTTLLHVAVKLHPVHTHHAFEWVRTLALPPGLGVTVHGTEQPQWPLVMASDVVIGMMSVLLVESILLGRPTMSFQPNATQADGLIATVLGAIPLLNTPEACERTLRGLLEDGPFRTAYLQRQTLLQMDGQATPRVVELILKIVERADERGMVDTADVKSESA